jgi:biotin transport system substrate-specific component
VGRFAELRADRRMLSAFAASVVGQLIVFGFGVPWLKVSADMSSSTIHDGFALFILGRLIKAVVAASVIRGAWRVVRSIDKPAG